jgi:hypothetical protein
MKVDIYNGQTGVVIGRSKDDPTSRFDVKMDDYENTLSVNVKNLASLHAPRQSVNAIGISEIVKETARKETEAISVSEQTKAGDRVVLKVGFFFLSITSIDDFVSLK